MAKQSTRPWVVPALACQERNGKGPRVLEKEPVNTNRWMKKGTSHRYGRMWLN